MRLVLNFLQEKDYKLVHQVPDQSFKYDEETLSDKGAILLSIKEKGLVPTNPWHHTNSEVKPTCAYLFKKNGHYFALFAPGIDKKDIGDSKSSNCSFPPPISTFLGYTTQELAKYFRKKEIPAKKVFSIFIICEVNPGFFPDYRRHFIAGFMQNEQLLFVDPKRSMGYPCEPLEQHFQEVEPSDDSRLSFKGDSTVCYSKKQSFINNWECGYWTFLFIKGMILQITKQENTTNLAATFSAVNKELPDKITSDKQKKLQEKSRPNIPKEDTSHITSKTLPSLFKDERWEEISSKTKNETDTTSPSAFDEWVFCQ